ncbi:uncharacterized protein UV8b_03155 [Ustilaginoidea virens]|uniref:Uncharacterized protein n=1 Tax=Ustilaginoidea virens TaxID=1159556 RepID=A0A8E5HPV8_USTVR|nr:uncharacterized protein UV8b_03155 [Ustilaginoidea virens]QUC18914.1 hypothetical protein UV8b_03155 [Ustilaginoidea virens]
MPFPRARPALPARRFSSAPPSPPNNPTAHFYRTFGRPVAKALLLAVFAYQLGYWGWAKLEADERRGAADAEMADLEARVRAVAARKAAAGTGE